MSKNETNKLAGIPKQFTSEVLEKKLDNNDSNLKLFDHLTSRIDTNGIYSADAYVRYQQAVKSESDVSISDTDEEWEKPRPVSHPYLAKDTRPRYFVNKQGVIYSKRHFSFTQLIRRKNCYILSNRTGSITLKLAEVMAYTFGEQPFDPSVDYFHYKDGNTKNCAWNNLIICDFQKLQQLEIKRLEKLYPGTKYTTVKNIHDSLTFNQYLVSDAGKVFSLRTFSQLTSRSHRGNLSVSLQSDTDHELGRVRRVHRFIHAIVYQSFNGSQKPDQLIIHSDDNKENNTLDNLKCLTRSQYKLNSKKQTQGHRMLQNQKPPSEKLLPQPPFSDGITWKSVGMVPEKGWMFYRYQVSSRGHVRYRTSEKLQLQYATNMGHVIVYLCRNPQDVTDTDNSEREKSEPVQVSHLVASVFVDGYSEENNEVVHLNGDPLDNRAENLCWKSRPISTINKKAHRVVVTLVDNAHFQKEFPSVASAQRGLLIRIGYKCAGTPFQKEVNWDGEQKQAMIKVFKPSKKIR